MGLIGIETLLDEDVSEFDDAWMTYREMTGGGIIHYSDDEVRTLHAKMSYLLSHAELNVGYAQANFKSSDVKLKLEKSRLFVIKYPDGPYNQRTVLVEADDHFIELSGENSGKEADLEIWKGKVNATKSAVELLSREITARLKK